MSSDKIYLSQEEQIFLMEMLEVDNPHVAVDKYANLMVLEHAEPQDLQIYIQKTIAAYKKRFKENK